MGKLQVLVHAIRKSFSSANSVLDLPTVDLLFNKRIPFFFVEIASRLNLIKEGLPDLMASLSIQLPISQGDMDSALKSIIEGGDSIGCEEKDTREVLELAQEHGDKRIALDVMDGALFKEYIRFVDKYHSIPSMSDVEYFVQGGIKILGRCSQISSSDNIQWFAKI